MPKISPKIKRIQNQPMILQAMPLIMDIMAITKKMAKIKVKGNNIIPEYWEP